MTDLDRMLHFFTLRFPPQREPPKILPPNARKQLSGLQFPQPAEPNKYHLRLLRNNIFYNNMSQKRSKNRKSNIYVPVALTQPTTAAEAASMAPKSPASDRSARHLARSNKYDFDHISPISNQYSSKQIHPFLTHLALFLFSTHCRTPTSWWRRKNPYIF